MNIMERIDYCQGRVDQDVDLIPDSDTREDDLIELIDLKYDTEREEN